MSFQAGRGLSLCREAAPSSIEEPTTATSLYEITFKIYSASLLALLECLRPIPDGTDTTGSRVRFVL